MSRGAKAETEYMIRSIESAETHYQVLRLKQDADAKTIKTTVRDMLRTIHPDKCGAAGLEATKRVNEAGSLSLTPATSSTAACRAATRRRPVERTQWHGSAA